MRRLKNRMPRFEFESTHPVFGLTRQKSDSTRRAVTVRRLSPAAMS